MKSVFNRGLLAVLILVSLHAQAVPLDITDSDKVSDVIAKLYGAMSSIVSQAGVESRMTMMDNYQRLDAAIQNLANRFSDLEGKTMKDLNQAERQLFTDIQSTLDNLDGRLKGPFDKTIGAVKDFNTVLAQITVRKPLITSYGPANIGPVGRVSTVPIQITGFKLCPGDSVPEATLKIGSKVVKSEGECINNQIVFLVPRSYFASEDKAIGLGLAQLTISYSTSKWLGLSSSTEEVKFRLMFNILPNKLGKVIYNARYLVNKKVPPRRKVTEEILTYSHDGSSGVAEKCWPISHRDGWRYDFVNAKAVVTPGCDHPEGGGEVTNPSDYNICLKVWAKITDKHQASCTTGHLEVDLVKNDADTEEVMAPPVEKEFGWDALTLPLFERATSQIMQIQLFDGEIIPVSATQAQDFMPYFRVRPDPANRVVFVRPVRSW